MNSIFDIVTQCCEIGGEILGRLFHRFKAHHMCSPVLRAKRCCHVIENRAQHRWNPEQQSRRGDDFTPRPHGRRPEGSVRSC